jgi:hypothetical protein
MKYLIECFECITGSEIIISVPYNEQIDDLNEFKEIVHRLIECEEVNLIYKEIKI